MPDGGDRGAGLLSIDTGPNLMTDRGEPDHNRRLTDKILAAFNHAYSFGETEIADQLMAVLARSEEEGAQPGRRDCQATYQAECWMDFVRARERYKQLVDSGHEVEDEVEPALEDMRAAYRRWSDC